MYIIAIAWIYVVLMMAITETTLTASIMTFLFYCVLPLALFFYLIRAPKRKQLGREQGKLKSYTALPDNQSPEKTVVAHLDDAN